MEAINDSLKNVAKAIELLTVSDAFQESSVKEALALLEKTVDVLSNSVE